MRVRLSAVALAAPVVAAVLGASCTFDSSSLAPPIDIDGGHPVDVDVDGSPPAAVPQYSELWYSVDNLLVRIELDPNDGRAVGVFTSLMEPPPPVGQNMLTMLPDGSLVGGRLVDDDNLTHLYRIDDPPRDGSPAAVTELGVMIDELLLEALYTDCEGRLYGMDTGVSDWDPRGNRLLRFTGNVVEGEFSYAVVSDLETATAGDVDDMSPSISNNQITDNPGFVIDTGKIYAMNYETGDSAFLALGGRWGIWALGGSLFTDQTARAYVMTQTARLFELRTNPYTLVGPLAAGPTDVRGDAPGWSGLAGPLTQCDSGFAPE